MENVGTAVMLVGHGAAARDMPRSVLGELRSLAARRREDGVGEPSVRERELERTVRGWPRTPETDPYKAGLERVAVALGSRIAPIPVVAAYNELCSPSLDEALVDLREGGFGRVLVMTTMLTPGGNHAEVDVPTWVAAARARNPKLEIEYVWPVDVDLFAEFLARTASPHLLAGGAP